MGPTRTIVRPVPLRGRQASTKLGILEALRTRNLDLTNAVRHPVGISAFVAGDQKHGLHVKAEVTVEEEASGEEVGVPVVAHPLQNLRPQ